MGRPYEQELRSLKKTYDWARKTTIKNLADSIGRIGCAPLLIVGSGGSFTVAHFGASLHQRYSGKFAKAVTPLEALSSVATLHKPAVMVLSARGQNPDIVGAFKRIVSYEPARLVVLCSNKTSSLVQSARKYRNVEVINFDLPQGKDGFLATNSLLAYELLLARGYSAAYSRHDSLPRNIEELICGSDTLDEFKEALRKLCSPLWSRQILIVLYGNATQTAALDIESKLTEAALSPVQLSDYRNFAHGRHHWLAKRSHETGVIAFISEEDRAIAGKTLSLFPIDVPIARIHVPGEAISAGLGAILATLFVVGLAGEAKGIDPGRPGVPLFGRKIYRLNAFNGIRKNTLQIRAVERKVGTQLMNSLPANELNRWKESLSGFTDRLCAARFAAIVCDYDGTLCDERDRFKGLSHEIVSELLRLLSLGLILGIATGRGKSVKEVLQGCLPRRFWSRVLIGYYNGAQIALLGDDFKPLADERVCESLMDIANRLQESEIIREQCETTYRQKQITLVPKSPALDEIIWRTALELTRDSNSCEASVRRSSHSIDITAPGVTKRELVANIRIRVGPGVLCIGDKGRFPGNDFDLLKEPFSLSVDEISTDPDTCWNLTPYGYSGVQGTRYYLQSLLESKDGCARLLLREK